MLYSVFIPELKRYDYYEDGTSTAKFPNPTHLRGTAHVAAESAGWPLPKGARKIGAGPVAKGQIASLGDAGVNGSLWSLVGWGILGYGAWKLWQLTRKRG